MPPSLIFGAGGIGRGVISYSWVDASQTSSLLTTLEALGLTELDSAAGYPPGAPWVTEGLLGETKAAERGFVIDTKILAKREEGGIGTLSQEGIDESLAKSLELLGTKQVNVLYAHAPDSSTPAEETARAFDKHFRAGSFKKLGLSNYSTAQMAEYLKVCREKGYVKPSYYQGHYNAITRQGEEELYPLLRAHGIKIVAYGPLAGGFLTGKVSLPSSDKEKILKGGRFESGKFPLYEVTFDKDDVHAAVRAFALKCEQKGMTPTEVSLRWIMWHSVLTDGDSIILGATREEQLKKNVEFCQREKLDDDLVKACEELWTTARGVIGGGWAL
ncbi:related to aflatoxin B1 aldehyde reductase [Rhynchosporium agropyri]|uniref:Related to aflatoxin B1 aldehyde reductase n=1 Tax=Rhynchosporium agropyri TaxID=914238 RepID=A0A1E1LP82_9HELO|nr:related to aflatoxin B1 aldehyde reductase [Rhynchosporium agropyri]